MEKYNLNILEKALIELKIEYDGHQLDQFIIYYDFLVEINKVMNLTAITEFNEVVIKHFVDSLAIVKFLDMREYHNVIDIGTGAGFPGIPLKICFPDIRLTLLDSLNKKIKFLRQLVDKLLLEDVEAIHGRAEDVSHEILRRESYDLCVSRAVSNMSTLSEYCIPFVKIGGLFVAYKSEGVIEEIKQAEKAIKKLGGKMNQIKEMKLPCSDIKRTFLIVNKIKTTDKKYPRKAGLPSREPIS